MLQILNISSYSFCKGTGSSCVIDIAQQRGCNFFSRNTNLKLKPIQYLSKVWYLLYKYAIDRIQCYSCAVRKHRLLHPEYIFGIIYIYMLGYLFLSYLLQLVSAASGRFRIISALQLLQVSETYLFVLCILHSRFITSLLILWLSLFSIFLSYVYNQEEVSHFLC